MKQTIFERYGGFAKVSRIVMRFYDRIVDSPVTGPYFAGTDMKRLIDHQTRFIATVMGGPASYTNDHLERVHVGLGIDNAAFTEAITLLEETLEEFDFAPEDIRVVREELLSRKNFIISKA